MTSQNIFLLGLFLSVFSLGYLLIRGWLGVKTDPRSRGPQEPAPPDPLAPDLARLVPATATSRERLQLLLWTAGFYRPSALTEYLAIRATLVVGFLMATGLIALQIQEHLIGMSVLIGSLATGTAWSLPRVILGMLASNRARSLRRGLPTAMDVISLCLTAGQNMLSSLEITSRELAGVNPPLSQELSIVHQQAKMHSLELALTQWANRVDVPEIRSFVLLLVQSQRLGTDMVTTLLEFADNQRTRIRQRAEAQANRASLWMLFPTVFCLWVASAIILVGPAYIEFWKFRREQLDKLLLNARNQVEQSNNPATASGSAQPGEQGAASRPGSPRLIPNPRDPLAPFPAQPKQGP